jgi:hypothetical protein
MNRLMRVWRWCRPWVAVREDLCELAEHVRRDGDYAQSRLDSICDRLFTLELQAGIHSPQPSSDDAPLPVDIAPGMELDRRPFHRPDKHAVGGYIEQRLAAVETHLAQVAGVASVALQLGRDAEQLIQLTHQPEDIDPEPSSVG